jgi:hypothetical protein
VGSHWLPTTGPFAFVPKQGWAGRPVRNEDGKVGAYDKAGRFWSWDKSGHAGGHWDVVDRDGSRTNVTEDGREIGVDPPPGNSPPTSEQVASELHAIASFATYTVVAVTAAGCFTLLFWSVVAVATA